MRRVRVTFCLCTHTKHGKITCIGVVHTNVVSSSVTYRASWEGGWEEVGKGQERRGGPLSAVRCGRVSRGFRPRSRGATRVGYPKGCCRACSWCHRLSVPPYHPMTTAHPREVLPGSIGRRRGNTRQLPPLVSCAQPQRQRTTQTDHPITTPCPPGASGASSRAAVNVGSADGRGHPRGGGVSRVPCDVAYGRARAARYGSRRSTVGRVCASPRTRRICRFRFALPARSLDV